MKKFFPYTLYLIPYTLYLIPYTLYLFPSFLTSCQKDINVKLPPAKIKVVVDGRVEPGYAPYVILTHNTAYVSSVNLYGVQNMFIHDAYIKVFDGTSAVVLNEFCSKSLPDSTLRDIAYMTGVDTLILKNYDFCVYTTFTPAIYGKVGKTYSLTITTDGKTYTSSTSILKPVPLNNFSWQAAKDDTLGFIHAHLTDPPQPGNAYRWLTKTIHKDVSFSSFSESVLDDKLINGQSIDLEYGYYNKGDTVLVKFCSIDQASFNFFRQMDIVYSNQGNPFASPTSVPTNIYPQGEALGIWCGYGAAPVDTVVCK